MQSQGLDPWDILPSADRPQGGSLFRVTDRPLAEVLRSAYDRNTFANVQFKPTVGGQVAYYVWEFFQRTRSRENMNYLIIDTYLDWVGKGKLKLTIPKDKLLD
jgi:hypothetical protein